MIFALIKNDGGGNFIVVNSIVLSDGDTSLYDGKYDYIIQICNLYGGGLLGWIYDPNSQTFTPPATIICDREN